MFLEGVFHLELTVAFTQSLHFFAFLLGGVATSKRVFAVFNPLTGGLYIDAKLRRNLSNGTPVEMM